MSIRALLDYEQLLEFYNKDAEQFPTPLQEFFAGTPENVDDDEVRYLVSDREQRPAPFNRRGAPARVLDTRGLTERIGAIFHAFNQIRFPNDLMLGLREPDSELLDRKSAKEIRRGLEGFGKRHVIQKEVTLAKILFDGQVIANKEGDIIESVGSATDMEVYDFGIPSDHKGDLSGIVTTPLDLDDPDFDLQEWLDQIDEAASESNVAPPTDIFLHTSNRHKLRKNTQFNTLAAEVPAAANALLHGELIPGIFGKNWHFHNHTYEDNNKTTKPVIPKTKMLLVPPMSTGYLRPLNGIELVPTTIDLQTSLDEALNAVQEVYGRFAYAAVSHNPLALHAFIGDHYGWVIRDPEAIWAPDIN